MGTVFAAMPKIIRTQDFMQGQPAGQTSSAILVVFLAADKEHRIASGGPTGATGPVGWKRIDYEVELNIFHRSTDPDSIVAMQDFDALVEALKVRLREDRTMGNTFWQDGEGVFGIVGEYGEPKLTGDVTETWGRLTFEATEMIRS